MGGKNTTTVKRPSPTPPVVQQTSAVITPVGPTNDVILPEVAAPNSSVAINAQQNKADTAQTLFGNSPITPHDLSRLGLARRRRLQGVVNNGL